MHSFAPLSRGSPGRSLKSPSPPSLQLPVTHHGALGPRASATQRARSSARASVAMHAHLTGSRLAIFRARTAAPIHQISAWAGGAGVLAGDLRERPRRRASERSERALLAAPPERPLSPKR